MSMIAYAIIGLLVGFFIIRRVKMALGINVIGDGHLIEKWKKKREERRKSMDVKRGLKPRRWLGWRRRKK